MGCWGTAGEETNTYQAYASMCSPELEFQSESILTEPPKALKVSAFYRRGKPSGEAHWAEGTLLVSGGSEVKLQLVSEAPRGPAHQRWG